MACVVSTCLLAKFIMQIRDSKLLFIPLAGSTERDRRVLSSSFAFPPPLPGKIRLLWSFYLSFFFFIVCVCVCVGGVVDHPVSCWMGQAPHMQRWSVGLSHQTHWPITSLGAGCIWIDQKKKSRSLPEQRLCSFTWLVFRSHMPVRSRKSLHTRHTHTHTYMDAHTLTHVHTPIHRHMLRHSL